MMNCARAPSLVWGCFCFVVAEVTSVNGMSSCERTLCEMWHFRTFPPTSGRTSQRLNITARVKLLQSAKPLARAERRDCNKCASTPSQNCVVVRSPPPNPPPPDCLCLFLRRRIITFALHGETPAIHHPNEVQPGPRSITRCLVSQPR